MCKIIELWQSFERIGMKRSEMEIKSYELVIIPFWLDQMTRVLTYI